MYYHEHKGYPVSYPELLVPEATRRAAAQQRKAFEAAKAAERAAGKPPTGTPFADKPQFWGKIGDSFSFLRSFARRRRVVGWHEIRFLLQCEALRCSLTSFRHPIFASRLRGVHEHAAAEEDRQPASATMG